MRLTTVNLRHGGSTERFRAIVQYPAIRDSDVLVLTEYRDTEIGRGHRETLRSAGWRGATWTEGLRENGVLLATKEVASPAVLPAELSDHGRSIIGVDYRGIEILGVYLPHGKGKIPAFEALGARAREFRREPPHGVMLGDFNTGRDDIDIEINVRAGEVSERYSATTQYLSLEAAWPEAWRLRNPEAREFSWYSWAYRKKQFNGWRLDHAFVSPALTDRIVEATYVHEIREQKLTDHSALTLVLADS